MPFDGPGLDECSRQLEGIDRVAALLATEDRWCKGTLTTADGRRCLLSAIIEARAEALKPTVLQAIEEVTGRHFSRIEKFNDARATTYPLLRAVIERARQDVALGLAIPAGPGGAAARVRSAAPGLSTGPLARLWQRWR